jgi:hypothetical protein
MTDAYHSDRSGSVITSRNNPQPWRRWVAAAFLAMVSVPSAGAEPPPVGRYQMFTGPAFQSGESPTLYVLDTVTGQTWVLGKTAEWLPLQYWGGVGEPKTPLPPSPPKR